MKPVEFRGNSLEDLRTFPELAKREAGYQIDRVQNGLEPDDFKPMATVGKSVYEIRVQEPSGAFRVIYIAKLKQFCIRPALLSKEDSKDLEEGYRPCKKSFPGTRNGDS